MRINLKNIKELFFFLIWIFLIYFIIFDDVSKNIISDHILKFDNFSILIFLFLHIIFAVLFLPCSSLTFMSGVIWGPFYGLIISLIATTISGIVTFILGRYSRIDYLIKNFKKHPFKKKLFFFIEKYKWKSSILVHLNPIFPGSSLGYFFGITKISFINFFLGLVGGTLPLQIMFVALGDTSNKIDLLNLELKNVLVISLILILIIIYSKLAKKINDD